MLSLGEKPVAKQLIDGEGEAVIHHGLLEINLLCRDKIVFDHKLVGHILDDIIVLVEVACGEGVRLLLLQILPSLRLRSGEPDGVEAGDGGIPS